MIREMLRMHAFDLISVLHFNERSRVLPVEHEVDFLDALPAIRAVVERKATIPSDEVITGYGFDQAPAIGRI